MLDAYDEFIAARLAEGVTADQIADEVKRRLLAFNQMCVYCENEATLLCDFVIGFEKKGAVTVPSVFIKGVGVTKPYDRDYISFDSEMFTCDLRICEHCGTRGDTVFICGSEGGSYVKDHCKEHTDCPEIELSRLVMTAEQAQTIRNQTLIRLLTSHPHLSRQK